MFESKKVGIRGAPGAHLAAACGEEMVPSAKKVNIHTNTHPPQKLLKNTCCPDTLPRPTLKKSYIFHNSRDLIHPVHRGAITALRGAWHSLGAPKLSLSKGLSLS